MHVFWVAGCKKCHLLLNVTRSWHVEDLCFPHEGLCVAITSSSRTTGDEKIVIKSHRTESQWLSQTGPPLHVKSPPGFPKLSWKAYVSVSSALALIGCAGLGGSVLNGVSILKSVGGRNPFCPTILLLTDFVQLRCSSSSQLFSGKGRKAKGNHIFWMFRFRCFSWVDRIVRIILLRWQNFLFVG